jgi:hypothetical protein
MQGNVWEFKDPSNPWLEFQRAWQLSQNRNPSWRKGQAFYNTLYKLDPGLAKGIRRTESDPFDHDERIPKAVEFVKQAWSGN